jgi:O-antigen/teichoic acid export membrane protein
MASRARTVVANATSVFASDAVNRATTFVVYALVGRKLGKFEFGQISLALTFFYVFQVPGLGIKTLVTREVAKKRESTGAYVTNACALVLVLSVVSMALLFVIVELLSYSSSTANVILVVALGLLPYSLTAVFEAVFQAHERMTFIVAANAPVALVRVALAIVLLARGYGVVALVVMLVASWAVVALIEFGLLVRYITSDLHGFDTTKARSLAEASMPFLGIEGLIALLSSITVILLSKLANETEAGLYNAANQLLTPMMLVIQSVALSVFPMMCRRFQSDVRQLARTAESAIAALFAFSLVVVVGVSFVARDLLVLLYGDEFAGAATALRILLWQLGALALTSVLGQLLFAVGRERITLRIVAIDAVVTVGLGIVLIQAFGVTGAAVTAVAVKAMDVVLHYAPAKRITPDLSLARLLWAPIVAAAGAAATFAALSFAGPVVAVVAATLAYGAALVVLESWAAGGVHAVTGRYAHLWSE